MNFTQLHRFNTKIQFFPVWSPLLLHSLIIGLLGMYYGEIILHPNSYLFSSEGDGIKNYFTFAGSVNSNHFWQFQQMNYPYGESVWYTDSIPLLTLFLKLIKWFIPEVIHYSVGILNFLLLANIWLTAYLFFRLLRKLKVFPLLAILGAVSIAWMSPQLPRLGGHYALGFSFFFPAMMLILRQHTFIENSFWKRHPLFLLILCAFLTHAYLGMMLVLLAVSFGLASYLGDRMVHKEVNKNHFTLVTWSVLAFLTFFVLVKSTDGHQHRTTNPWGIYEHYAHWTDWLLPPHSSWSQRWIEHFELPQQNWESSNYFGGVLIGIALLLFLATMLKWIRIPKLKAFSLESRWILLLCMAALPIMLLALFIPFRWHLEIIVEQFSWIKQFRAIGRFAWVGYYIFTVAIIYALNRVIIRRHIRHFHWALSFFAVAILLGNIWEGHHNHKALSKEIRISSNLFHQSEFQKSYGIDLTTIQTNRYQAIWPLPYYHIGSENFSCAPISKEVIPFSMLLSYHTGLPLMANYSTRTSISESKSLMQFMGDPNFEKPIFNDLIFDRKILLAQWENHLLSEEKRLKNTATEKSTGDRWKLLELDLLRWKKRQKMEQEPLYWSAERESMGSIPHKSLIVDFESGNSSKKSDGLHLTEIPQAGFTVLWKDTVGHLQPDHSYKATFWMFHGTSNAGQDALSGFFFWQKRKGEQIEWEFPLVNAGNSFHHHKNWTLVEVPVNVEPGYAYELVYKGPDYGNGMVKLKGLWVGY